MRDLISDFNSMEGNSESLELVRKSNSGAELTPALYMPRINSMQYTQRSPDITDSKVANRGLGTRLTAPNDVTAPKFPFAESGLGSRSLVLF